MAAHFKVGRVTQMITSRSLQLAILHVTILWLSIATPPIQAAESLIGTKAPEWQVTDWFNSTPLKLSELRGKVVLVRWWTAPDCPYCRATAPALNEFYREYHPRGLEVIGFYHHKSDQPLDPKQVRKFARQFAFQFPIATDSDWQTLQRWGLDRSSHAWTSVSLLIDRHGIIRHIHPGGQYVKGDQDYAVMKKKIEELLAEAR